MNRQKNTEKPDAFLKQFDDLKKKHPDALLLFRRNDLYEIYREDAVKAAREHCAHLMVAVLGGFLYLENDLLSFHRT